MLPGVASGLVRRKESLRRFVRQLLSSGARAPASRGDAAFEFSIGIYLGESPLALAPPPGLENPVLTARDVTDVPADFIADPFMLKVDSVWHMFFEVISRQTWKGKIGHAVSADGLHWRYQQIVLAEPFHLSYPYVFEWERTYYMVPESYKAGAIRLYRASPFPDHWSFVGSLLRGPHLRDPSIVRHGGKWWLFAEASPERRFDLLRLYHADDLTGPWVEHPRSPIVRDNPRSARPAGRVLAMGNHLVRYAQDSLPTYGARVRAFEIAELTDRTYREREVSESPVLQASGSGWNASGMHHIDPHPLGDGGWIACVDGWRWLDHPGASPPGGSADRSPPIAGLGQIEPGP